MKRLIAILCLLPLSVNAEGICTSVLELSETIEQSRDRKVPMSTLVKILEKQDMSKELRDGLRLVVTTVYSGASSAQVYSLCLQSENRQTGDPL